MSDGIVSLQAMSDGIVSLQAMSEGIVSPQVRLMELFNNKLRVMEWFQVMFIRMLKKFRLHIFQLSIFVNVNVSEKVIKFE